MALAPGQALKLASVYPRVPGSQSTANVSAAWQLANAPAGASPAGTPTTPGQVDYTTLLQNDPLLKQTLAGLNASGVQNQAGLQAAQQRALIQYGNVPAGLAAPGLGAIDQTTRDLAQQNTAAGLSTYAKLGQAHTVADQTSVASEAARGMLRSGAYGQHAAENLQGYNQAQNDSVQQLLDYLNGIYSGYLGQAQTLQGSAASAQSDALTRLIQQIQAGLITDGAATTPTASAAPPARAPLQAPYFDGLPSATPVRGRTVNA